LSLTVALALGVAFALGRPLPFLAPIFALVFTAAPKPPMGMKGLLALVVLVAVTLGIGLVLIPVFRYYPVSAVLIVGAGLYFSTYLSVNLGKGAVGTFLTMGITLIPVAGMIDFSVAVGVVNAILVGMGTAVVCQWIVYPAFPEPTASAVKKTAAPATVAPSDWIALRTALIVLPPFLLALNNPSMFMPIIMKSVSLGQQASGLQTRRAGRELLGSTFMGGFFAILFWFGLDILPNLWIFFWMMLLFCLVMTSCMYQLVPNRFLPSFWSNSIVTMLILLGPAVQDSAGGKDVYKAFAVRMGLFVAVTIYAWLAVVSLEWWRGRLDRRQSSFTSGKEMPAT